MQKENLPLVSVIIPCYNVELYIEECIATVIKQTHPKVEIICVDNNSTDNTYEKLLKLKNQFHNIKLLQEVKPGAPAARNKGLRIAKGEWVQFLDADDILLPEKISSQLEISRANANKVNIVLGSFNRENIDGTHKYTEIIKDDLWQGLFFSRLGITSCILWRRLILEKVGGWDEELRSSQEYDLLFRIFKLVPLNSVVFDPHVLTVTRERASGSITKSDPHNNYIRFTKLRCSIINYLKRNEKEYFEGEKQFYYNYIYERIRVISFHDIELSLKLYNDTLPKRFVPKYSRFSGKSFLLINRLFGYDAALNIKALFNKLANL